MSSCERDPKKRTMAKEVYVEISQAATKEGQA